MPDPRGLAYRVQEELELALGDFRCAAVGHEVAAGAHFAIAQILAETGRLREARAECERALAVDPNLQGAKILWNDLRRNGTGRRGWLTELLGVGHRGRDAAPSPVGVLRGGQYPQRSEEDAAIMTRSRASKPRRVGLYWGGDEDRPQHEAAQDGARTPDISVRASSRWRDARRARGSSSRRASSQCGAGDGPRGRGSPA